MCGPHGPPPLLDPNLLGSVAAGQFGPKETCTHNQDPAQPPRRWPFTVPHPRRPTSGDTFYGRLRLALKIAPPLMITVTESLCFATSMQCRLQPGVDCRCALCHAEYHKRWPTTPSIGPPCLCGASPWPHLTGVDRRAAMLDHLPKAAPLLGPAEELGSKLSRWYPSHPDLWDPSLYTGRVGSNVPRSHFQGNVQYSAILNLELNNYFKSTARRAREAPYAVNDGQARLLQEIGMEVPIDGAPSVPHGFHKNLEESQLRIISSLVVARQYELISCKLAKQHLLPEPGAVQNPVMEARDVYRYPDSAIATSTLNPAFPVHVFHDVTSVVGPHALVERLVAEHREGHILATGVNPPEFLKHRSSFHYNSHRIVYELERDEAVWYPTGSDSEGYRQPVSVTQSWHHHHAIRASNGCLYQIVLLDYRYGHCLWHVFAGTQSSDRARQFSTGTLVEVPALLTGTGRSEMLEREFATGMIDFANRTLVQTRDNYAAKASGLKSASGGVITARDCEIGVNLADWGRTARGPASVARLWAYRLGCFLTLDWATAFSNVSSAVTLIQERLNTIVVQTTEGGGWTAAVHTHDPGASIPNNPTWLERLTAATSMVFCLLVPKLVVAEVVARVYHVHTIWEVVKTTLDWLELTWPRSALIATTLSLGQLFPTRATAAITYWVRHYWRQLWLPGSLFYWYHRVCCELAGGPGYRIGYCGPGRGVVWQLGCWCVILHELLPGLVGAQFMPGFIGYWSLGMLSAHPGFACFWLCCGLWVGLQYMRHTGRLRLPQPSTGRLGQLYAWAYRQLALPDANGSTSAARLPHVPRVVHPVAIQPVPMPARVVQAPYVPTGAAVPLAISPTGLVFHDWVQQVAQAYAANPTTYPPLVPGQDCFFAHVAAVAGGTSHQWFSWFHSMRGTLLGDLPQPLGWTSPAEIQRFCATSQFGYAFHGTRNEAAPPSNGWPVLHMEMTVQNNIYHVAPIILPAISPAVSQLAVLIATASACDPAWAAAHHRRHMRRGTQIPRLGAFATAVCDIAGPINATDVSLALNASVWTAPLTPAGGAGPPVAGYRWDFNRFPLGVDQPRPPLIVEYGPAPTFVGATPTTAAEPATATTDPASTAPKLSAHTPVGAAPAPPSGPMGSFRPIFRKATGKAPVTGGGPRPTVQRHDWRPVQVRNLTLNTPVGSVPLPAKPSFTRTSELQRQLHESVKHASMTLPARPLEREIVTYTVDLNRAKRLVSDLVAQPSLLGSSCKDAIGIARAADCVVDHLIRSRAVITAPLTLLLGCAGCGKTTATGDLFNEMTYEERLQVRVVTHTQRLRAAEKEAHSQSGLRGFSFPTIETILSQPTTGWVIFDDARKLWGGLIDLVLAINPMIPGVVVNGDPAQGSSHTPYVGGQSEYLPSCLDSVLPLATKYATISHRFPKIIASTLGLYTTNPTEGHITFTLTATGCPTLVASPRYMGVLRGGGIEAKTHDTVQGETYKCDVELDFTGMASGTTDSCSTVSLTRSTTGVYLHGSPVESGSTSLVPPTASPILNALLYDMRLRDSHIGQPCATSRMAFLAHLMRSMPIFDASPVGHVADWTTFANHVPTAHHDPAAEPTASEPSSADQPAQDVFPCDSIDNEVCPLDGESRERAARGVMTRQFRETATVNPQTHHPTDQATRAMMLAKRITRSTPAANLQLMATNPRTDMCVMFDLMQPVVPQWADHAGYYTDTAVLTYASTRSQQTVMQKLARHDPDRTGCDVQLSMKGQVIKKVEALGAPAKAAQAIHMYDIRITLEERAVWRFIEDLVMHNFGENVVIYNRESQTSFAARVGPRLRRCKTLTGSDATGWDAGCDAAVLNFDVHVLRRAGVPDHFVQQYVHRRTHTRSQYGYMATMQNSGDGGTYVMNSIRDAVMTTIRMRVQPLFEAFCATQVGQQHLTKSGVAPYGPMDVARRADPPPLLLINGDDVTLGADASTHPDKLVVDRFPDSRWVFKDERHHTIQFSGMELNTTGRVGYSPYGLWYRCAIKAESGTTDPIQWAAYADLFRGVTVADKYTAEVAKYLLAHLPESVVRGLTPPEYQAQVALVASDPSYSEFRSSVIAPALRQHANWHDR